MASSASVNVHTVNIQDERVSSRDASGQKGGADTQKSATTNPHSLEPGLFQAPYCTQHPSDQAQDGHCRGPHFPDEETKRLGQDQKTRVGGALSPHSREPPPPPSERPSGHATYLAWEGVGMSPQRGAVQCRGAMQISGWRQGMSEQLHTPN